MWICIRVFSDRSLYFCFLFIFINILTFHNYLCFLLIPIHSLSNPKLVLLCVCVLFHLFSPHIHSNSHKHTHTTCHTKSVVFFKHLYQCVCACIVIVFLVCLYFLKINFITFGGYNKNNWLNMQQMRLEMADTIGESQSLTYVSTCTHTQTRYETHNNECECVCVCAYVCLYICLVVLKYVSPSSCSGKLVYCFFNFVLFVI